ncbi:hypothetical protein PHYSODRAFT_250380 [Phytophthora sojae]|uniref:Uncharacterized protein n=1 Tax=Phytophthora sojae (strain P6497) TaxID=1094619 RepID=G4ZYQ3_PHYSP|nr:hypothetical protein PHYSODRAFT_250380 [Phytophthora sojae]EGZ12086.1 hypothetical protein PHYSODRAFT_250380 [Phytophthora sojae]|eukprot:XP_009532419.1 hypothetical protein PHYSODRAFT_250380 [Phytophthora sojae]
MAHLSERHGEAMQRRGELMQERMQLLAIRTGYPEVFNRPRRSSPSSTANATAVVAASSQLGSSSIRAISRDSSYPYQQRRTPEEMAEFSRLCEQRVALTKEKGIQAQRQALAAEQQRQARSQLAGEAAPAQAVQRLRERREKQRRAAEAELEALVNQQDSSLEAMNIARMLSPRFQERMEYAPSVAKYSAEDERVKQLLGTTRIGTYYQ